MVDSAFNLRLDDEAIRHYRESLNLVPGSWAMRNNLASALIQLGKPSNALGILQESLEITKGTETSALKHPHTPSSFGRRRMWIWEDTWKPSMTWTKC